jgi:hypothetical protein
MRPGWLWRISAAVAALLLLCLGCTGTPVPAATPTLLPLPTLTPVPEHPLPGAVRSITVRPTATGIDLGWPAVPDAAFYMVTRRLVGGADWSNVAMVDPHAETAGRLEYLDDMAAPGVRYEYAVAAANDVGGNSAPAISNGVEWRKS